jgi:2-methylisocitrate lyase-like PEP mutase family enzyme
MSSPKKSTLKPTTRFRELMARKTISVLPAVGDPFSARIVAAEGYEAVMTSGNASSAMRLGIPDIGLLTMSENAENAGRVAHVTGLPVFVDADTGYGNPLNVRRTIQEMERQGVAAVMIEDQVTPKRCAMFAGKEVVSAEEMEMKLKAALDARRDDDLVICARTDALTVHGIDEALRRAEHYVKAGADMIFVEGPRTIAEAERIGKAIGVPMIYNITPSGSVPPIDARTAEKLGYRFLSFSVYVLLAAIPGMQSFLKTMRETGDIKAAGKHAASMKTYLELLGFEDWKQYEDVYATGKDPGKA